MYGPLSTVDPDVVENDVGAIWRELYKLEKHFGEEANPLGMAKKVQWPCVQHMFSICRYMYVCSTNVHHTVPHALVHVQVSWCMYVLVS